jgi:hypothetical protein
MSIAIFGVANLARTFATSYRYRTIALLNCTEGLLNSFAIFSLLAPFVIPNSRYSGSQLGKI